MGLLNHDGADDSGGMAIEPGDEGEVLLHKIARLKQALLREESEGRKLKAEYSNSNGLTANEKKEEEGVIDCE
jgi:hypothetical protein